MDELHRSMKVGGRLMLHILGLDDEHGVLFIVPLFPDNFYSYLSSIDRKKKASGAFYFLPGYSSTLVPTWRLHRISWKITMQYAGNPVSK